MIMSSFRPLGKMVTACWQTSMHMWDVGFLLCPGTPRPVLVCGSSPGLLGLSMLLLRLSRGKGCREKSRKRKGMQAGVQAEVSERPLPRESPEPQVILPAGHEQY